jgi:hypothetical protein
VSYDDELDAHGRERLGVLYTYLSIRRARACTLGGAVHL